MKSMYKLSKAGIALAIIALLAVGSGRIHATTDKGPVSITAVYDFSTFPNVVGTFTTTGALTISGPATMHIDPIVKGNVAHCVVTLIADDGSGTITIHQQCEFSTSPPKGEWEIVSGTGAYVDLKGNGSLLMPPKTEAMTGTIY